MTGSANTWCFLAVTFGSLGLIYSVAVFIAFLSNESILHTLEKDIMRTVVALIMIISSCYCAKKCSECYDVQFAVAMKNLEYQHTYTTETSVRLKDPKIEYQPIDKSE